MAVFICAVILGVAHGWQHPGAAPVGAAQGFRTHSPLNRPSATRASLRMEARSEEERRRQLAALYPGRELAAGDRPRSSEVQPMQATGVLRQPWGPLSLVDVVGAQSPLDGVFRPLLDAGKSELFVLRMDLPLGILFEEAAPGRFEVVEVVEQGGANGRVLPGDTLRATTCVRMAMSYPAWQLALGGIGRPTSQKKLLEITPFPSDSSPPVAFETVMGAIQSNAQGSPGGNGQVILLVERPKP
ncbi:hypothetical protein T492DRAFT_1059229 [Pavlovales sp. CCMP2436]|nr:hypothetical protein T492DRAFT_1059229 [Pavlovales sp. CCMP2436]